MRIAALKASVLGVTLAVSLFAAAAASARAARCEIRNDEGQSYAGPCDFKVAQGGTFTVEPMGGRRDILGASLLTVTVTAPGEAEVSGLTSSGIDSRWGHAERSRSDPACWVGSDFRVCVR